MADQKLPKGPKLYNAETGKPDMVSDDQLDQAVLQGTHGFALGTRVNVVSPSGRVTSLPAEEVKGALEDGFTIEKPRDQAVREYVEDNDNAKGAIKVFGGQLFDEALMGIPELIADKTMDPLEVAKKDALKEEHQLANAIGGTSGFGLSMFVGGPLLKGATKAGSIAEKVVAQKLAAAGIKRGSGNIAKEIVARTAENAAALGTEGLISSLPRAVTEAALGDPDLAAETMLWGVGTGAALGIMGGAVSPFFDKIKKLGSAAKDKVEKRLDDALTPLPDAQNLETQYLEKDFIGDLPPEIAGAKNVVANKELPKSLLERYRKGIGKKSAAAPYVRAAEQDLIESGYLAQADNILPSQVGDAPILKEVDAYVMQNGGEYGQELARKRLTQQRAATQAIGDNLVNNASVSMADNGQAIFEAITKNLDAKADEFKKAYEDIGLTFRNIGIQKGELSDFSKSILKQQTIKLSPNGPEATIAKQIQGMVDNATQLDDLWEISKMIKSDMRGLGRSTDKEAARLKQVYSEAIGKLDDLIEAKLEKSAQAIAGQEGSLIAKETLEQLRSTNSGYRTFKEDATTLGRQLKKSGSINSADDFEEQFFREGAEKFADKLLKNPRKETLEFLQEKMPEVAEIVRNAKKAEIANMMKNPGQIEPETFLKVWNKMSKEERLFFFGEKGARNIQSAKQLLNTLPGLHNGSNSGRYLSIWNEANNLQNVTLTGLAINAAKGMAEKQLYKQIAKDAMKNNSVLITEEALKSGGQRLDKIKEIYKNLDKGIQNRTKDTARPASIDAINRFLFPNNEEIKKRNQSKPEALKELVDNISEYVANPSAMTQNIAGMLDGYSKNGAPEITEKLGALMHKSVQYLYTSMPKTWKMDNPFNPQPFRPSDADIAKFERKLSVVMDPFIVLDELQNGTITADHIEALQTLYPKLYDAMKMRFIEEASQAKVKVPYDLRLKLALFMGGEFESSVNPASIMDFQNSFARQAQNGAAGPDGQLNQSGLKNLNLAESTQTEVDRRTYQS